MPIQRSFVILITFMALATLPLPATATPAHDRSSATAQPATQARTLATRFFRLLQRGDGRGLRSFLAPEFQLQRTDGTGATKGEYLRDPARVQSFTLSRFKATRRGRTLVARYWVVTSETIGGVQFSEEPAPRLSVFRRTSAGWRIVAHANFNPPSSRWRPASRTYRPARAEAVSRWSPMNPFPWHS